MDHRRKLDLILNGVLVVLVKYKVTYLESGGGRGMKILFRQHYLLVCCSFMDDDDDDAVQGMQRGVSPTTYISLT